LKVALVFCAALVAAAAAAGDEPPVLEELAARTDRRPVVLIPGVTGGKLREVESGRVVWGEGRNIFFPKDGAYELARPLGDDVRVPELETFGVIQELRFFGFKRRIYGPLAELMEANGYQFGDLTRPEPDDSFFMFAYDWRGDLVDAAIELARLLEGVREVRGVERLEVDLIGQSAGGQIGRYLVKYADAPLEAAESGVVGPAAVDVAKLILIGTANGGGIRILRELHRGRTYIPAVGRRIHPEVLFTFTSLFQDLPVYREDLFLDAEGKTVDLDLFEAATWEEYGFSIFAEETHERVKESGSEGLFGSTEQRLQALDTFLESALRLHTVLRRDVEGFSTRYYSIQNTADETPERAVLVGSEAEGWDLLFSGDKQLAKLGLPAEAITTLGDGHASVESQLWLSPQERAAMSAEPFDVDGEHFKMILDPGAQLRLLEYLAD
jgi:hypothetical protein